MFTAIKSYLAALLLPRPVRCRRCHKRLTVPAERKAGISRYCAKKEDEFLAGINKPPGASI